MDYDVEAHERACLAHPLVEITEARFQEMLEILPPRKWRRGADLETFNMMDFQIGDVTDQFARITLSGVDRFSPGRSAITTRRPGSPTTSARAWPRKPQ